MGYGLRLVIVKTVPEHESFFKPQNLQGFLFMNDT